MSTLESAAPEPLVTVQLPDDGPVSAVDRFRVLLVVAVGPLIAGFAAIAALLALVVALTPAAPFATTRVLAAAGPGWLVAYHVPVRLGGHELGVLPLLPTLLLLVLVARCCAAAADRLATDTPRAALPLLAAAGLGHGLFGLALALLTARGPVAVSPVLAFFLPGALALLAASAGVANRCGLTEALLYRADQAVRLGLRAAVPGAFGLLGVAALVLTLALIGDFSAATAVYRAQAPDLGSGLGMSLLCLAYLPNLLVGTAAFVAGPGAQVGAANLAPLTFRPGPLPPLPITAVLPHQPAGWWALLFLLPAGIGALVGWWCRPLGRRTDRLRAVLVAALVLALGALVAAALSGGDLATGPFTPVTIPAGLLAVAVFGWTAAPGTLVAWLTDQHRTHDDHDDYYTDDEYYADDAEDGFAEDWSETEEAAEESGENVESEDHAEPEDEVEAADADTGDGDAYSLDHDNKAETDPDQG